MKIYNAVIVYQAGIANVFAYPKADHPNYRAVRLLQSDFRSCEYYIRGLRDAGIPCRVMYCNKAGDIIQQDWTTNQEDSPFREQAAFTCLGDAIGLFPN